MPSSVVFCGTPEFAVPALLALLDDPAFTVELVITQPDRPVGRKQILTPPPVKEAALARGIEVWQPESLNREFKDLAAEAPLDHPDFLVVVAYGQILSQEILDTPKIAPINVHASLLPRWRGASPLQHAVLAGDKVSGVTIQRMVKELDAGDILAQTSLDLPPRVTAPQLHNALSELGAELLVQTLKQPLNPQPQEGDVTVCGKLNRSDGVVDFSLMTAEDIDRRVRAFTPWPGVTTTIDGQPLKLIETSLEQINDSVPVACSKQTTLYLVRVQAPGKTPVSGIEWRK